MTDCDVRESSVTPLSLVLYQTTPRGSDIGRSSCFYTLSLTLQCHQHQIIKLMSIHLRTLRLSSIFRLTSKSRRRPSPHALAASFSTTARQSNAQSTINADEISHFSRLSALWWDEQGEFQMLHRMNPTRMRFIREKMVSLTLTAVRMQS
jgi:hypothetical protein